jgi:ankyrin repeat protein
MVKFATMWIQSRWTLLSLFLLITLDVASGDPLLIAAVQDRDRDAVRDLISRDVDVNAPQPDGATALHWAVHRDDFEVTRMLIEAGADLNVTNDFGVMPLSLACTNGSASMVETLLKAGAESGAALFTGETVLMTAAYAGALDTVEVLLRHGADVNAAESARGQTALMWALGEGHTDVVRSLIEHGANVSAMTSTGFAPLLFAAREGDVASARLLLDEGADPNTRVEEEAPDSEVELKSRQDSTSLSALHIAVQRGHTSVAHLLIERGADPNYDTPGWTPLHWAAGTWETELNGLNGITAPKGHEWDTLRGVQEGKFELVKALLNHGADPNAQLTRTPARYGFTATRHPKDMTPIGLAAFAGEADIMRLLAEHGADLSLRTQNGLSPLLIAAGVIRFSLGWQQENAVPEEDLLAAVQAALELGADVHETDHAGNTALHGAAWLRSEKMIRFLVAKGGDINARTRDGQSPLSIAERNGRTAGGGAIERNTKTASVIRELSVPAAVTKALDSWTSIPRHVREAVESLLEGELAKIVDGPDYISITSQREKAKEREEKRARESEKAK